MNRTEAQYLTHLETLLHAGTVAAFYFEKVKLRLAEKTYYTPDFLVVLPDGRIEFHEVKGFWRDDARVKFKVAAEQFPWFRFVAVTRPKIGGWNFEARNETSREVPLRTTSLPGL